MARQSKSDIAKLLREIMLTKRWTQSRIAEELSTPDRVVSQSRVSRWLKDEVPEGPTYTAIVALHRQVIGGSELEDNGEGADIDAVTRAMQNGLQLAGTVEAGAFRKVDLLNQEELKRIPITKDARFPHLSQYAWLVRGDSADLAGIRDGMYAIGALFGDWVEFEGEDTGGRFVIIQRTRDDGAEIELTVKEPKFFSDRIELHPKSSNPKHQPIVVPRDTNPEDADEVRIIAVVLNAVTVF